MSLYEYKGFKYDYEDEHEPELIKRYHYVTNSLGERSLIDFSPYSTMSEETFKKYIDLGMPKRIEKRISVPLDKDSIEELWEQNSRRFIVDD